MKALKFFFVFLFFLGFISLNSCKKNNDNPPDEKKTMLDLIISHDFNYITNVNVPVYITFPEGVSWHRTEILSTDEDNIFYKGMPTDTTARVLEASVNIATYIKEVLVRYGDGTICETSLVPVTDNGIYHEFQICSGKYNSGLKDVDTDGDGVIDSEDDYPEDSLRAFNIPYPGAFGDYKDGKCIYQFASYIFEDLWPGYGDYDFNDLVVDFYYIAVVCHTWVHGLYIQDIIATYKFRAIGATLVNGFGIEYMGIPHGHVKNVRWRYPGGSWNNDFSDLLTEGYITLLSNNVEDGQEYAVTIITDDVKNVLPNPGGSAFVNTVPSAPYEPPVTIQLKITFPWVHRPYYGCSIPWWAYPWTTTSLCYRDINPFLIIDGIRGKELHLVDYPPTDLVDPSYFGQLNDDSDPATGRYYKSHINLPWALDIPISFGYAIEKADLTYAYPDFAAWAESGGVVNQDWYKPENADPAYVYEPPIK